MEDVYDILKQINQLEQQAAMATIVHVEGSAYLKEGTIMLILEDGTTIGMVSAGCLEEDLKFRAQDVIGNRIPQTVCYEMQSSDDLSWGHGAGCNGIIYIVLEPLNKQLLNHFKSVYEKLIEGIHIQQVKVLTNHFNQTHSFFISKDLEMIGDGLPELCHPFTENIPSGIQFNYHLFTPIYYHLFSPQPRLIIFGAGYDARPLALFAYEAGFSVTVCDWRPAFCEKNFFPPTTQIIVGHPNEIFDRLNLGKKDFVVIMTHQFQKDQQLLTLFKSQNVRYLGLLGSKQRTDRLISITNSNYKIYSPVGLSIGAKGPYEIAISIVAELIQILRKESVINE